MDWKIKAGVAALILAIWALMVVGPRVAPSKGGGIADVSVRRTCDFAEFEGNEYVVCLDGYTRKTVELDTNPFQSEGGP